MYNTFWTRAGGTAALLVSAAFMAGTAQADRAVVVGINEYPKLAQGSNLEGCVNDAKGIETTLKAQGFEVVSLTNEQASAHRPALRFSFEPLTQFRRQNCNDPLKPGFSGFLL